MCNYYWFLEEKSMIYFLFWFWPWSYKPCVYLQEVTKVMAGWQHCDQDQTSFIQMGTWQYQASQILIWHHTSFNHEIVFNYVHKALFILHCYTSTLPIYQSFSTSARRSALHLKVTALQCHSQCRDGNTTTATHLNANAVEYEQTLQLMINTMYTHAYLWLSPVFGY